VNQHTGPDQTETPARLAGEFRIDWGLHGLLRLLSAHQFSSVLDIGAGAGEHKRMFELFGKQVYSVDILKNADYVGDFIEVELDRKFDLIWCSHVLEHQRNIGLFLDKIFDALPDSGLLAIIVPTHPRDVMISGHLSSWSIPLLCYNLIMAGFDCCHAQIMDTYELSLIVRKRAAEHDERHKPSAHGSDAGVEFAHLKPFFPFEAGQGVAISGPGQVNWDTPFQYALPAFSGHPGMELTIRSKTLAQYPDFMPQITCPSGRCTINPD
jgi:SAM-dependent methyltransferase